MDAHKLVVLTAMPDDQGQWIQRVIDTQKGVRRSTERAARSQSSESGNCLRKVVGRRERDARGPKSGQEQIGCNTGEHVCLRGCYAGDTTNQCVQNHCESSCETKEKGQHDCLMARHDIRVAFFHAKGRRASRGHSSKGLAPPGVGRKCVKAWYGTREASKCWETRSLTH